ncbi:phosphatase PAP2 family protein [Sphingobacterium lactis]|nr:phosphatase PAP2 family protein [Sphingobacterium lactis]
MMCVLVFKYISQIDRVVVKSAGVLLLTMCIGLSAYAQRADTARFQEGEAVDGKVSPMYHREYAVPAVFLTFGIVSLRNPYIKHQDRGLRDGLQRDNHDRFPIDDYTQYVPTASFLALDLLGVEAKHNFKSRLFTGLVAHGLMAGTVNLMKGSLPVMRPDHSAANSFPSGHTATAFVGAELMWQEYRHQSVWYGVSAYAVAAGTGFFRMYNNKHWFSDVVMGAGVGILSVKAAYLLLPLVEGRLKGKKRAYVLIPTYNGEQYGLSLHCSLH